MGRYRLVVLSNPVAGREDEFNDWYTNQHLADVVSVPGFVSAQRFKFQYASAGEFEKYLAIYEMDTEDPEEALHRLLALGDCGEMHISEALDMDAVKCGVFEVLSPVVTAPAEGAA